MRRSTRRKLKVYAVDAAIILLAAQVTVVLKADNKAEASTYTAMQTVQDEYAKTGSDVETKVSESDTEDISISESVQSWNSKDSEILLKIAMAEAEGEGTEGKALVMKVVLNRVASKEFPNSMYINWKMLAVFSQCGSAPESAWCALIAALLGECGICGWIKTSKEKHRRKQDYNEPADPGGEYQGDAGDSEGMEDEEQ